MEEQLSVDVLYDRPGGPVAVVKLDGKSQFLLTRGAIKWTIAKLSEAMDQIDWHQAQLVLAWLFSGKRHLMLKGEAKRTAAALCGKTPPTYLDGWTLSPLAGPEPPKLNDICQTCVRVWERRQKSD